jgi:hypothetical protein
MVNIQNNGYRNNHIGVSIPGNGGGYSGPVIWQTPFIGNSISSGSSQLLPPCDADLPNYSSNYGYAGVVDLGANFTVGESGFLQNRFTNLRNGIIGENVFLNVNNAKFEHIIGFLDTGFPNYSDSKGVGVACNKCWVNIKNSRFIDGGHGMYLNGGFMSVQGNYTSRVHRSLESWNSYSIGVTKDNVFNFLDNGIRARELIVAPFFSGFNIDKNIFNTENQPTSSQGFSGIEVVNAFNTTMPAIANITRNEIYINDNINGITVGNQNDWDIADNTVEFSDGTDNIPVFGAGIQLDNSAINYLYNNAVSDAAGIAGFSSGFSVNGSSGNVFCCNNTSGNAQGSVFTGSSNDTRFKHNEMSAHTTPLLLFPGTVIGDQPSQIDLQDPTTNSNLFLEGCGIAVHADLTLAGLSEFFTRDEAHPYWPDDVNPKPGWFTANSANPSECSGDAQCSIVEYTEGKRRKVINETDIAIVEGTMVRSTYGPALQWEGERDLYTRLKQNPDMSGNVSSVDNFYAVKESGSALKAFYEADQVLENIERIPASWGQIMEQAHVKIDEIEEDFNQKLNQLAQVNTTADSINIYWEAAAIRSGLVQPMSIFLEKQHQADSLRQARATAALSIIEALPEADILQSNRKTALRIYTALKASGYNRLTQAQFVDISPVANQCPLSGGKAVYLARALYRLNEDKQFDDGTICGLAERGDINTLRKPLLQNLSLQPNPTTGFIQVLLSDTNEEQQVIIHVTDISGKVVLSTMPSVADDGLCSLDASVLAPGVYICQVSTPSKVFSPLKFIIIR